MIKVRIVSGYHEGRVYEIEKDSLEQGVLIAGEKFQMHLYKNTGTGKNPQGEYPFAFQSTTTIEKGNN